MPEELLDTNLALQREVRIALVQAGTQLEAIAQSPFDAGLFAMFEVEDARRGALKADVGDGFR